MSASEVGLSEMQQRNLDRVQKIFDSYCEASKYANSEVSFLIVKTLQIGDESAKAACAKLMDKAEKIKKLIAHLKLGNSLSKEDSIHIKPVSMEMILGYDEVERQKRKCHLIASLVRDPGWIRAM